MPAFSALSRPATPALLEMTTTMCVELFASLVLSMRAWRFDPEKTGKRGESSQVWSSVTLTVSLLLRIASLLYHKVGSKIHSNWETTMALGRQQHTVHSHCSQQCFLCGKQSVLGRGSLLSTCTRMAEARSAQASRWVSKVIKSYATVTW